MDVCCLRHMPFERPSNIAEWAAVRDHDFTIMRPYLDERLPARALPQHCTARRWHGESSAGCSVQAFEHPFAPGLQFHLEVIPEGVSGLIRKCSGDIGSGPCEQARVKNAFRLEI